MKPVKVVIPHAVFEQMIAHCRSCLPNEACGILAGTDTTVTHIFPVKNAEASPSRYLMDPREQFDVMKRMRETDLYMLAIYHSHPDSPERPSAQDIRRAYYDETAYVIVSFAEPMPAVKGYRIAAGTAFEIEMEMERKGA